MKFEVSDTNLINRNKIQNRNFNYTIKVSKHLEAQVFTVFGKTMKFFH